MSNGRKASYPLKNIPSVISDQSGVSEESVQEAIDALMKRIVDRARREQKKDSSSGAAILELLIAQYVFSALDSMLEDIDMEEVAKARRDLGMPGKKLVN